MCASYAAPVRVGKRSPFGGRGARELLFAQEPDRGGADVDRAPAGACLGSRAAVALCLAEDGDRAVVEVDVGVAQAEQLILTAKERVQLIADRGLMDSAAPRSGRVEVTLRNGQTVSHFTQHPPGTKENPLSTERVNEKAHSLMTPVLGIERTEEVIRRVNALEELNEVHELRPLLAG